MATICLITPGQPSTDPRLVKEADALVEAGHDVSVICAYWTGWALEADRALLAARRWRCFTVGGTPFGRVWRYRWTRLRHRAARGLIGRGARGAPVVRRGLCRVGPELENAAGRIPAHLYIAHNLAALPAALGAARRRGARVGFDIEDFHSAAPSAGAWVDLAEAVERRCLARCDYLTASSPHIADAYARKYGVPAPTTVLNVFPLAERPNGARHPTSDGPVSLYWFSQTIGPERGLEDAVRAMALLGDLEVELHLRGEWQGSYRERLFSLAASLGVDAARILSHPPAAPGEMVKLAAAHDVGLALEVPRSAERDLCLSNKIFTYLLAGNALAATGTRAQRDLTAGLGAAALTYPPGDADALASGLRRWCENRSSLAEAQRQAWEWGTRRYNWEAEKPKLVDLIEALLERDTHRQ